MNLTADDALLSYICGLICQKIYLDDFDYFYCPQITFKKRSCLLTIIESHKILILKEITKWSNVHCIDLLV